MIRHFNDSVMICLLTIIAVGVTLFIPTVNAQTPLYFGWSSVAPHTADYDGDGRMEMGLYDSTKGTIYARKINGTELAFDMTIALPGFIAACADFDGDGKADPASYDFTSGVLYAFLSTRGYQLGALPCTVGASTTKAVPADYDGDHKADPAFYDSVSGTWIIFPSASGYQPVSFILGGNSATAVPMDYDGDGKSDPCVYDQTTGLWKMLCSASQYALTYVVYGGPGCVAAPADFDGDLKADPTVYCSALGVWGTLNSASNYAPNIIIQGGPNRIPIPGNYYFTNQADYALYNTTNGCWNIVYNNLGGIYTMLGSEFLKGLVNGAGRATGKDIAGWSMNKIFNHNNNPTDPHWPEEQQTLSEMNQKLDTILDGQVAIQNQISSLSAQLEYDINKVIALVDGGAANAACTKIITHYDQHGGDSYRYFYQCDTNNPPLNSDVLAFANNVIGTYDIKNEVTTIYTAIKPVVSTSRGLLWDWAALATNNLTPDNLYDNFTDLANYFGNMYMYQMKGVSMYVDSCRAVYTNASQRAETASYITNDVVTMIQDEVDIFRDVTYTYVMTAVNAAYNPLSTSNLLEVAGVSDTLAGLEFLSRLWLGQTETLCATFLTVDRPDVIAKYNNIYAITREMQQNVSLPAQTVATNRITGHAYGYLNSDLKNLVVTNGYVFLRNDFGVAPTNNYLIYNHEYNFGWVNVVNYDDNMQPTSDPTVTNWFGHLYASPYNYERLILPVADSSQWTRWTPVYSTYIGHYNVTKITDTWPTSLTNFSLGMTAEYNWRYGTKLPDAVYGVNISYEAYQVQVINGMPGSVNVRMNIGVDNTVLLFNYDADAVCKQRYSFTDAGGCAALAQPALTNTYNWLTESGSWTEPKWAEPYSDHHSWTTASQQGTLNAALQASAGQAATVIVAVGGEVAPSLGCYMGGAGNIYHTLVNQVSYSVNYVILSFY